MYSATTQIVSEGSPIKSFPADYPYIFDIFKHSHLPIFHGYVVAIKALGLPAIKLVGTNFHPQILI